MHSSTVLLALSGLVASVLAQNTGTAGTNFTINVPALSVQQKAVWCQGERNTCDILCAKNPKDNICSPDTLEFSCLCANGSAPGLQYYTQSMPTFICQQAFTECIAQNVGSQSGQQGCENNIRKNCGTQDPTTLADTTTSAGGSTPTADSTTSGSATSSPSASSTPNAAERVARYGNAAAAVVAFGLFAYLV